MGIKILALTALALAAQRVAATCFYAPTTRAVSGCACLSTCPVQWPSGAQGTCTVFSTTLCPGAVSQFGQTIDTCTGGHEIAALKILTPNATGGEDFRL
jgi:hypothetical protein